MAELVDALGSGPSGRKTVEVRVLFWAPRYRIAATPPILAAFCFLDGGPLRKFDGSAAELVGEIAEVSSRHVDCDPRRRLALSASRFFRTRDEGRAQARVRGCV